MSGSGSARLLQSENAMKKNSESALTSALENTNERAKANDRKNVPKAKRK